MILEGRLSDNGVWAQHRSNLGQFICNVLQKGYGNTKRSPGGMLWFLPWNNLQYVTSASLVLSIHADHLAAKGLTLQCPSGNVFPQDIVSFVKSQVLTIRLIRYTSIHLKQICKGTLLIVSFVCVYWNIHIQEKLKRNLNIALFRWITFSVTTRRR
jgi:hypothetical protein